MSQQEWVEAVFLIREEDVEGWPVALDLWRLKNSIL